VTLLEDLLAHAGRSGELALESDGEAFSYADVDRRGRGAAAQLADLGVCAGDRVVLAAENSADAVWAWLATLHLGAIEVALGPAEDPGIADRIAAAIRPRVILASQAARTAGLFRDRAFTPCEALGRGYAIAVDAVAPRTGVFEALREAGVVAIQYTSGSTGTAKGVALTADGVRATVFAGPHLAEQRDLRLYLGLPLCNSYGRTQLLELLYMGGQVVLGRGFGLPDELHGALERHAITALEAPPAVYELLIRSGGFRARGLPELRRLGMAGGRIRPGLIAELRRGCPGARLTNRYGVTEIAGGLCRTEILARHEAQAEFPCGPPFPFVEVRVVGDTGADQPAGEPGVIHVRSPGLMWGYFPERATSVWYDTGDIGRFTPDGELVLLSRAGDMIKRAGVRLFPQEIEAAIRGCAGVADVCVLGHWDARQGIERVHAFVALRPGAGDARDEVYRQCSTQIAREKRPDRVVFVDEIPLAATGKVDRKRLLQEVGL
jgi:acyl-CoA synthetase (AMP-forming)/AMP-acid ligase II